MKNMARRVEIRGRKRIIGKRRKREKAKRFKEWNPLLTRTDDNNEDDVMNHARIFFG